MRALPCILLLTVACKSGGGTPTAAAPASTGSEGRRAMNQLAARHDLPLFWKADRDGDGVADPEEIVPLLFYPSSERWRAAPPAERAAALAAMAPVDVPAGLPAEEAQRRTLVLEELDQGAPALVDNDLRGLSEEEKRFVEHILTASAHIDALYARMVGATALAPRLPEGDPASASVFRRNWGPACVAPRTVHQAACSAIPGAPRAVFDIYPASLQENAGFCAALEKRRDARQLLAPFVVVRETRGELVAVPYPEAYPEEMGAIAAELSAAAASLPDGEAALRAYLLAAAESFRSNDWAPADEAWAKMDARNSRWYLRVGPDETYWEPCSAKAGFHVTFALINKESLRWQEKLGPMTQKLEQRLAELIGPPYTARRVAFDLPDFIDIVINAGDDRDPMGATIGQSLPNFGPVAEEGRGRTVAMTNLYTDADSLEVRRKQAASLLAGETMTAYSDAAIPGLLGTILHEATHNLGPAAGYEIDGKSDGLVFGGPLASMLEELKAQTGALFYVDELLRAGVIDEKLARESYVDALVWSFGQISRGMFDEAGKPRPYPQLAAIHVGLLLDEGALLWDAAAPAANGSDRGAFTVNLARFPAAAEAMMKRVGAIKATGDRAAAEALVERYVKGDRVPRQIIEERFLRYPKNSFVYALEL
jgi:hypothetical protein